MHDCTLSVRLYGVGSRLQSLLVCGPSQAIRSDFLNTLKVFMTEAYQIINKPFLGQIRCVRPRKELKHAGQFVTKIWNQSLRESQCGFRYQREIYMKCMNFFFCSSECHVFTLTFRYLISRQYIHILHELQQF